LRQFCGNRARRDHRAADILRVQFHPQPFSQRAHSRLGGAVDRPARGEHFDPENRGHVDDVAAFLLLHVRQGSGNPYRSPLIFTSICRSHSSTFSAPIDAMGIMPALLRSTSTRPKPSTAPWMNASTSARFVTSVANPMALPPVAEIS